jgi:hypothetical protein
LCLVDERINTRFFEADDGQSYFNPQEGTVVDSTLLCSWQAAELLANTFDAEPGRALNGYLEENHCLLYGSRSSV